MIYDYHVFFSLKLLCVPPVTIPTLWLFFYHKFIQLARENPDLTVPLLSSLDNYTLSIFDHISSYTCRWI